MANDLMPRVGEVPAVSLSRSQRAAAVLLAVGPEVSAGVLRHLSDAEVEQVALEVATLEKLGPDTMRSILEEFQQEAIAHAHIVSGGADHARRLLRGWRGDEADDIVDRLLATVHLEPFHFVRLHEPSEVVAHLCDEHPQAVALILSYLPTKFAAAVLAGLDPELQGDVALRVATMEPPAPEVVAQVEGALEARLGGRTTYAQRDERGGVKELASMLNLADRGTERAIISNLESSDPNLAEQVRALMFVFEDLVKLHDRAIQEVMRTVDAKQLALALKGVKADVRQAVERNLSERAQQALAEEVELLGPARLTDVEAAQSDIVRTIRRLDEEGVIVMSRGDGDLID